MAHAHFIYGYWCFASEGLNAADVVTEEKIWTQIIDTYGGMDKPWVPDVVGAGICGWEARRCG